MTVKLDLIEESSINQTSSGLRVVRKAYLTSTDGTPAERLHRAFTVDGLPNFGDAHESIPGVVVTDKTVDPMGISSDKFIATLTYSPPNIGQIPGGSPQLNQLRVLGVYGTLSRTKTNHDIFGNQIVTQHTITTATESIGQVAYPYVEDDVALVTIRAARLELGNPIQKSAQFTAKVNDAPLTIFGFPVKARTVLCTALGGPTTDGGTTFDVAYELILSNQKNPLDPNQVIGFQSVVVHEDPITRQPVANPIAGLSLQIVRVKGEENFLTLNL